MAENNKNDFTCGQIDNNGGRHLYTFKRVATKYLQVSITPLELNGQSCVN